MSLLTENNRYLTHVPEAHATLVQVQHRPGAGVSVLYEVSAERGGGFIGLTTEQLPAPEAWEDYEQQHVTSASYLDPDEPQRTITVTRWQHPYDPKLPGLPLATDPHWIAELWGTGERLTRLETVTYRPLRRAVMRVSLSTPGPVVVTRWLYLKVTRPEAAAELRERHHLLVGAGLPVPRVLEPARPRGTRVSRPADAMDTVIALEESPGHPLSRDIMRDGGAGVSPGHLVALLDRLPATVMSLPRRPAWSERLDRYAEAARVALPDASERIGQVEARIQAILAQTDPGILTPTHGDFYEANLLMEAGIVTGLLDVDAVGPGHRVDDYACLLGHLAVLPGVDERYVHIDSALAHFGGVFEADLERHGATPRGLWARAAAVAISLVAGARMAGAARQAWEPAAYRRLDAAERLLAVARRSRLRS